MMDNFLKLLRGEFTRLIKYNIIQISFGVTLIWLAVIYLIGKEQASAFIPTIVFVDTALMTMIWIGASLFYEKQENTLKTLMVTPSGFGAILASKLVTAVYVALQSALLIAIFAAILFDVVVKFVPLVLFVIVITLVHTAIGFVFSIYSRDFNGLIAGVGLYMMLFAFPTIFYALGVLGEAAEWIFLFSPTHVSFLMINFSFGETVDAWMLVVGTMYLFALIAILFKWIIVPKYALSSVRD